MRFFVWLVGMAYLLWMVLSAVDCWGMAAILVVSLCSIETTDDGDGKSKNTDWEGL